MITLFSIPKPFAGASAVIQRNAIRSWKRLRPACEVILLGDDEGVAREAGALGVRHVPGVARNEFGTPLLSDAFRLAGEAAAHRLMGFVNADIVLFDDFPAAAARIPFREFLMAGRRWDLDVAGPWDPDSPGAAERFRRDALDRGKPHPRSGSDYFVFPRGTLGEFPPFAVGRPRWDNWFIYHARARRWPVIDASPCAFVVHQNHGYEHLKEGAGGDDWRGPEADRNLALAGGWEGVYILDDATHVLTPRALVAAVDDPYLRQRIDRYPARTLLQRGRRRAMDLLFSGRVLPDGLRRRLIYALSETSPGAAGGS